MEVSSVANSMQKFIDRLDGLNEKGRSFELKFKDIPLKYIDGDTGKDVMDSGWAHKTVDDNFVMVDEFMVQRKNEEEPILFIKFTREQTQDFTIKKSEPYYEYSKKWFFFKKEHLQYKKAITYSVTYTQEYWINVDFINITTVYKGKCS